MPAPAGTAAAAGAGSTGSRSTPSAGGASAASADVQLLLAAAVGAAAAVRRGSPHRGLMRRARAARSHEEAHSGVGAAGLLTEYTAAATSAAAAMSGEGLERPAVYVVATPIGNSGDITLRALQVLRHADVLFAEDTRELKDLLGRLGVQLAGRPAYSCHDFNEERAAGSIVAQLREGQCVALVSDAGTPLISDPGYHVLRRVRQELGDSVPVRPVPGACAAVAALCVAGMPTTRYLYAGFPSAKKEKKRRELRQLLQQACMGSPATLVIYEAPHRLLDTVEAIAEVLEEEGSRAERHVAVCRELTKRFETILRGDARDVLRRIKADANQQKGEFVLLVDGGKQKALQAGPGVDAAAATARGAAGGRRHSALGAGAAGEGGERMSVADVARLLAEELPRGKAKVLAAKICGESLKAVDKALGPVGPPRPFG